MFTVTLITDWWGGTATPQFARQELGKLSCVWYCPGHDFHTGKLNLMKLSAPVN